MTAHDYPFIEIAVHPTIRGRFAAGEGLVVLSPDIDYVYWANGAAARRFGYDTIYAFLEDAAFEETVIARQIAAAARQVTAERPALKLVLRLGSGFRRLATPCTIERIRLPDGQTALLLALPAEPRSKDSVAKARTMIDGFGDTETHVAILDRDGNSLAQSATFAALGIDGTTLETLIADVEREESRLVKRQITTRLGAMPAAIAHLSDQPPVYLVFVVETEPAEADSAAPEVAGAALEAPAEASVQAPPFAFDPAGRPVRFVWKIDSNGRFSDISPEFAETVGPYAADVIGRTFGELAQVFNLDPANAIVDLLNRRDTWSGRTVHWPVQGVGLAVPVDLAALPTYSREREFEGFRGFGVIRVADAAEDPERLGLALAPSATDPRDAAASPEPAAEDDGWSLSETAIPAPSNDDHAPHVEASGASSEISAQTPAEDATDPFHGEAPALRVVETPARRHSDKVIDLQQRRSRGREDLSRIDQAIFHQIGEELGRRLASRDDKADGETGPPIEAAETQPRGQATPAAEHVGAVVMQHAPAPEHVAAVTLERRPAQVVEPAASKPAEHVAAVVLPFVTAPAASTAPPLPLAPPEIDESRRSGRAMLTRALVDNLPLALLVHRGDQLIHANDEWLDLTGYPTLEALEDDGGLGALFADGPLLAEHCESAAPREDTLTLIHAYGERMQVRARLQSVGWGQGHALLLALTPQATEALDLPTRQDEETQSRLTEVEIDELRSILETATDGVVILDEDGAIRSTNRSASALFDYDAEETRGKPFAMLFAHESQRAVLDYVASLSHNGVASVLNDGREVIGREASGGFIPLFMTIGRLKGSNGYCAVIRDITHWKRTEEDLRAAKRAAETANAHKSEFLARVSHEIRTPLNAIIGFAEMMATERFGRLGSPRYLEYAHDIGRSGRHVLDIVNDLLDISKIEAGEQEMDFVAVSLNETLAETVSLLQPQANGQRVIIRTSLSTALPDVVADQRSVKQIAINLLSNAIRFTPPGGQIVVSTAYDQSGRVVMRVRDTGIGMSRAELDQAMKPFRQGATSPTRPRGEGTGLGLPLTRAMVEANRAQFSIESTPGEGTLVEIAFPPQRVLAG